MFFRMPRTVFIQRSAITLLGTMITLACAWATPGQMGGIDPDPGDKGTGGRSTIQGRIFYPSGRTVDHRLKITLTSVANFEMIAYADDTGAFSFRRLSNGTYTVIVNAGKEYLPARETVVIIEPTRRGGAGSIYPVQIQLQPRESISNKAALLDAELAGVPKPARDEYDKALQSAQAGDGKNAIEHLKNAVNLFPEFMLAYNEMGALYFRLGKLDEAAASLSRAIRIDPNVFAPRMNYGVVLFYKKQYREANAQLTRALEITETSARAHLFRGRTFIGMNDLGKAEKDFLRAVALGGGPDINEAHRFLGGIYREQGNHTRAIAELETYLKLVPNTRDGDQIRQIIRELRSKS